MWTIKKIWLRQKFFFFSVLKKYKRAKKYFFFFSEKKRILDFGPSGHVDLTFTLRFTQDVDQNRDATLNDISWKKK